jgi:hypothetical protein
MRKGMQETSGTGEGNTVATAGDVPDGASAVGGFRPQEGLEWLRVRVCETP